MRPLHVVTGAFGYSGRFIAQRLLDRGHEVRTLTNHPSTAFGGKVAVYPLDFSRPEALAAAMRGAEVLYNTYWVRFDHARFDHATAVENTLRLFRAASDAGVGRVVHVSITNPDEQSALGYFRGKARLERALRESGLSYAILRPAVLFGHGDILINNIAWMLRHFPLMGVFGDGNYRLQPIHVEDFADLAVEHGRSNENRVVEAIGPETFTYRELVVTLGRILGKRRPIVSIPPSVGLAIGEILGKLLGDVVITREEIEGLMQERLFVEGATPAGNTRLTEWAHEHRDTLGVRYESELARR
jgi:NADH dehydrogenase